jgi:putative ABC transport system permease protein
MWRVALADLRFRRRRFVITVLATAVVFAVTLLTSGVSATIHRQDERIVELFGADHWFVALGASGPFTTTTPIPASAADEVAALPGVARATPVILFRTIVEEAGGPSDVNVVATPLGDVGRPQLASGRQVSAPGEVVVDEALDLRPGSVVRLGGHTMDVVGTARDVSYFFGTPTVFVSLADAQAQFFGFLPLASAVAAEGTPVGDVAGLRAVSEDDARADLRRPTQRGDDTVRFLNVLLWIAAVGIVGSVVYLSAIERTRQFAVMKATGATNGSLFVGLALQAVVLSVTAAAAAAAFAALLAPRFPFAVEISASSYGVLAVTAIGVGLVASGAGLRRAVDVDPALAFGEM